VREALASARAVPDRLAGAGFTFEYPALEPALRHLLGRDAPPP
jgi:NAD dependent epimerase/dehydratase family enzyme